MTWLLCDYGEVLSLPPSPVDRRSVEEAALGGDPDRPEASEFWHAYWEHRPAYDRGDLSDGGYWAAVLGRRPTPDALDRLLARDIASWLHPNHDSLAAITRAATRGLRLALFSNAPHPVADAIDRQVWLKIVAPRLFSCRLGAVKPEPAAYLEALKALDAAPRDVIFLDDRSANVSAARDVGIRAELFLDATQIDNIDDDA